MSQKTPNKSCFIAHAQRSNQEHFQAEIALSAIYMTANVQPLKNGISLRKNFFYQIQKDFFHQIWIQLNLLPIFDKT